MLTRKASKWRPITPWWAYPDAKSWAVKEVGPRYRGQLCASAIPADHPLLRVGMTCSRAGTGRSTDLDRMGQADPFRTLGPMHEIETALSRMECCTTFDMHPRDIATTRSRGGADSSVTPPVGFFVNALVTTRAVGIYDRRGGLTPAAPRIKLGEGMRTRNPNLG